jgi:hypothetical protein
MKPKNTQPPTYQLIDCASQLRALFIAERMLDTHITAAELREVHDSVGISAN